VLSQDDEGGNIKVLVSSYSLLAAIRMTSNTYVLEQLQMKYGEVFQVITRYEPSRTLTNNDEIVYGNQIFKIQSIALQDEAARRFNTITASVANSSANSGEEIVTPTNEFHFTASGGETSVQSDSLIGWQGIIILFRDGVEYRVIRTGEPTMKQALYDSGTGTFTFNTGLVAMALNETLDAYLIS
jgi:hypothetical protein